MLSLSIYILSLLTGFLGAQPMEVHISDEVAPAAALVQLKVDLTDPHPITTGKMEYESDSSFFDSYEGFALYSPTGDVAGVAVIKANRASTWFTSPQSTFGTNLDYPILTMAIRTKAGLANGRTAVAQIDLNNSFWNLFGAGITALVKPGTITISNTAPWVFDMKMESPTVLRITGGNYSANTRVSVKDLLVTNLEVLSANDLRITLNTAAPMDGRVVRIRNDDTNQETTYGYYLRAVPFGATTRPALAAAVPIFSSVRRIAGFLAASPQAGSNFAALALQNENFSAAGTTIDLISSSGALLGRSTISIPAGAKYVREMQEIFNVAPPAGSNVSITSSAPLRMLGMQGNDATGVVLPAIVGDQPPGQITFSQTQLLFNYQIGGGLPAAQPLALGSTGTPVNYTAASSQNWLQAVPSSGSTPTTLSIVVNPAGLAIGTYSGSIIITGSSGGANSIPVTLNVFGGAASAAVITAPVAQSTLGSSATFQWNNTGASKYRLDVGRSAGASDIFTAETAQFSLTVTGIPQTAGLVFVQLSTFSNSAYLPPVAVSYATNPAAGSGFRFVPITPCRLADTRAGSGFSGAFGTPGLAAGATRSFPAPSGGCGIPASAQAYSLNVTVVPSGPLSFLTAWPAGAARPLVSTLNAFDGTITSNAALVPAGSGGAINLFATEATDVIIDINGYFSGAAQALSLYTVTPCRVADTRLTGLTIAASTSRDFGVAQSACLPAAAQAYSLNVTAVPPAPMAFLTAYPTGQARPNVSTLNSFDGAIKANAALVPAGLGGAVSMFASDRTDVVLDINAYFAAPGAANALQFYPLTPCRVADTRDPGNTALTAGVSRDFTVNGLCGVPASARAYAMNITVVPAAPLSFLTAWPAGSARPLVSTLNSFAGKIVANAAIVPAGPAGAISIFATSPTHVILDINGFFAP